MKKFTRRERKIYKAGKTAGYMDGYAKGLYDGNPFNNLVDSLAAAARNLGETMKDPEVIKAIKEQRKNETF